MKLQGQVKQSSHQEDHRLPHRGTHRPAGN